MKLSGRWGPLIAVTGIVLVVVFGAVLVRMSSQPLSTAAPSSFAVLAPASTASAAAAATPSAVPTASPSSTAASGTAAGHLPGKPDPALTPGAVNPDVTQSTIGSTICVSGWTATVRPPASYTTALKRKQIAQYGWTDTRLADYEEDHLVSLELGGAPKDPANLWPEPYTATLPDGTPVGARVKDQIENKLHSLVCSGAMPLATAQHLIATDWIGAWRQYVTH